MSETKFYVKQGLVQKAKGKILGGFDLNRFFKWASDKYHIPFVDECCDSAKTSFPVRYNSSTGSIEFAAADGTWTSADDNQGVVTALTAHAGGGQGSATALVSGFNEVTVAATVGDSVKLPAAIAGLVVIVKNDGATAIDVFPATGDTINDGSANTAVRLAVGATATYRAINTTNWEASNEVVDAGTLFTNSITERTSGSGVTILKNTIQKRTAAAIDTSATTSAAQIAGGLITSTSAATVTVTLPTASSLASQVGAAQGTSVDFIVDNSAGSNIVTVAVNTGITAVTAVITGGATLTVAAGATGQFRIYFTSGSVAKIARIY